MPAGDQLSVTGRTKPTIASSFLALLGILTIIQLRGDSYFPFPKTWPQNQLMAIVLVHTIVLVALVGAVAWMLITNHRQRDWILPRILVVSGASITPIVLLGIASGLHALQARHFRDLGYQINDYVIARYYVLSIVPLLGFWLWALAKKRFSARGMFAAVMLSAFVLKALPLELFPVTAKRSDMLPILYESGAKLLQWDNPYQYYLLDNGVQTPNVRFPGLILAYLPAVAVSFDLRWITLSYELVFLTAVGLFALPSRNSALPNRGLLAVLAVFVLLPYWHYRHELYEIPFWAVLFATLYALHRGTIPAFTIGLGLLIATHQWGCLFWPFFLIFVMRKQGWKPAVYSGLGSIILGSTVFFVVAGANFLDFYEHIVGTYKRITADQVFYPMSMYLTPYVVKHIAAAWLFPLQAFLQVVFLVVACRMENSLPALCGIATLSLTAQLLFSPVAWTYQYLLVVTLLILGLVFKDRAQDQPAPA